jgi:hypothetical protein
MFGMTEPFAKFGANLKYSGKLFPKFWVHLWNKRTIFGTI